MATIQSILPSVPLAEKENTLNMLKTSNSFSAPSYHHIEDVLLYEHSLIKTKVDSALSRLKPVVLTIDHTFRVA